MSFFEKMWRSEDKTGVKGLHPDFHTNSDPWYFNKVERRSWTIKVRFSFDDPAELNDCPFRAKIGVNLDNKVPGKYIGFAYGEDKDQTTLVAWAQKFKFAELIEGLDDKSVSTAESKITPIKG